MENVRPSYRIRRWRIAPSAWMDTSLLAITTTLRSQRQRKQTTTSMFGFRFQMEVSLFSVPIRRLLSQVLRCFTPFKKHTAQATVRTMQVTRKVLVHRRLIALVIRDSQDQTAPSNRHVWVLEQALPPR
eukprot:PhF_6_TR8002/c0_g1_i1/m.12337